MLHREKRQADARVKPHKLDGVYAFEVLRRFVGDVEAERACEVEYPLGETADLRRSGCED